MQINFKKHYLDFLILLSIFIILWGAFVRITGSGAGCGESWPLCGDLIIPKDNFYEARKTWIEYIHRSTSGVYGILILLLPFIYKANKQQRVFSFAVLILTIIEGLIGALLVKKGLVEYSQSYWRGLVIALHLCNTLLLMGALSALRYIYAYNQYLCFSNINRSEKFKIYYMAFGIAITAVFGAIAALTNTLFPSHSLLEGINKDLNMESHLFLKIRIFHPVLAVILAFALDQFFRQFSKGKLRILSIALVWSQLLFGLLTLFLLSPVWMKLGHLLMANLLWLVFVFVVCRMLNNQNSS